MLYGVKPLDPLTFVVVSAVLMLVSLIASSAPAYRAARLDPMTLYRRVIAAGSRPTSRAALVMIWLSSGNRSGGT